MAIGQGGMNRDKRLQVTRNEGEVHRSYINMLKYINSSKNTLQYLGEGAEDTYGAEKPI